MKINYPYLITISLVTALGGLLFGFDISVISGTIPFIQEYFDINEAMKGFVVSSALAGCIVGAAYSGRLGDRYGRKKVLFVTAVLFAISAVGSGWADSVTGFIFYRVLGGFAVGGASVLAPVYIAEVSPAAIRGRMVSLNQLTIVIGISLAYYSNYLLLPVGENAWRWMLTAEVIPALLFMTSLAVIPESPRWLTAKKRSEDALAVLKRIGGSDFALRELNLITDSLKGFTQRSVLKDVFQKRYRFVLLLAVFLAVFQQWSGINVILFYAPDIFAQSKLGLQSALLFTTLIGLVNLVFTFVAIWLIDMAGRKLLIVVGAAGMAVCYTLIGFFFYTGSTESVFLLILILLTIAFFATGLAPTVWVVISEIFPNRVRGTAMSVATFALWTACYLLTLSFPVFVEWFSSAFTFGIYAVICFAGGFIVLKYLPETRGISLEELETKLIKQD
jgi:sugar porter (SP) family MFS transporter